MQFYQPITEFDRNGFTVVVDRTDDDIDPWSQLNECFDSKTQLYADIESGKYEWFMLRVRVMLRGHEMACSHLGGCLYEDVQGVVTDGTVEDQLIQLMPEALRELNRLAQHHQVILATIDE
jgi:hypothetical protein